MNRYRQHEKGFTFVEIIIAVMLLAIATSTLIGLESSAIQRTVFDRNTQQAMLAARRIMSIIEKDRDNPMMSSHIEGKVKDVLSQLGAADISDEGEKQALAPFSALVDIEDWKLPLPDGRSLEMEKIALTISWGPTPDETFPLLYFVPK